MIYLQLFPRSLKLVSTIPQNAPRQAPHNIFYHTDAWWKTESAKYVKSWQRANAEVNAVYYFTNRSALCNG